MTMLKDRIQMAKELYDDGRRFIFDELWIKDTSTLSTIKRMLFSLCRIVFLVVRGFQQDNCSLQSSALTYITLVSLVPIMAIMFSFSKGMGMQNKLLENIGLQRYEEMRADGVRHWRYEVIPAERLRAGNETESNGQAQGNSSSGKIDAGLAHKLPGPMQEALIKIFEYVENTSFAALGLIGSIMLLFSVIGSMSKLEKSFNQIWGVKKPRNLMRKCSEYLVVLILIPVIFIVATSLNTLLLSNGVMAYLQNHFGQVAAMLRLTVSMAGYAFILFGFAFFYMFMPNTRVKPFPAAVGGISTGLLWYGVQWAYLNMQIGLTKYNSIYGTFAVLPFFLAWLYVNWSIILLGAEVTFAVQNYRTIHIEKASESASMGLCITLAQIVMFEACKAFRKGSANWSPTEYALERNIPARIMHNVVDTLAKSRLLVRVAGDDLGQDFYVPGKDMANISPADVEEAFRQTQSLNTRMYLKELPARLRDYYVSSYSNYTSMLSSMTFGKLVSDEDGQQEGAAS